MVAIPVDSKLDLQSLELLNAVMQRLTALPGSPVEAQFLYDSNVGVKTAKFWNGTEWVVVDVRKVADGTIPLAKLATDPLARANHTGTQLAATISNFDTAVRANRLDQLATPTADVALGSRKITGLADGVSATDAATVGQMQAYADLGAAGIDNKPSVRLVSNTNVASLSGSQTLDGIATAAGNRVLLVGQTTASQNGPWLTAAGAWTRPADVVTPGSFWMVEEGTSFAASQWKVATTGTIVLGTTSLTINQFGAGASYANGNGLDLVSTTFSVKALPSGGITVAVGGVSVDRAKVPFIATGTIGTGGAGPYTFNHGLGTEFVSVFLRDAASPKRLRMASWSVTDSNNVSIEPDVTYASNAVRVIVSTAA